MRPSLLIPSLVLTAALAGSAVAQSNSASVSFGLQQDTSEPVEVTSDNLEVDQNAGEALFTGDVLVVQGEMKLTAPSLRVEYSQGEEGRIERAHATGGVTIVNPTEAAESDEAVYTVGSGSILMTGDVLLTQGQTTLSGDRATFDLETGQGQMQGRVRTLFRGDGD